MKINIITVGANKTLDFACSELSRLLTAIDSTVKISRRFDLSLDGVKIQCGDGKIDSFKIDIEGGCGVIYGSNPRSALFGVYRTLFGLGARFPSPEREVLPAYTLTPENFTVHCEESASYGHRGVCIEGAITYENALDMIKWLPKVYMNGYFFQFFLPYTFFDRWYSAHGKKLTEDEVAEMYRRLSDEVTLRGLELHATGHGWTCVPVGITKGIGGWDKVHYELPPETTRFLAEINGKRELSNGVTLNTNLCYSNPEVRSRVANSIADYCKKNPQIDYLHLWLADGSNNHCECSECQKKRPSDWYVMLLNEVDAALTAANIPTKIVFLIYVDLLWEPETEKFANPDRFTLMFAPITRTYSATYAEGLKEPSPELSPYLRNKLVMPKGLPENIACLRKWQQIFDGDSFDFDYHLMWDHFRDPGFTENSRILFDDMVSLRDIGLGGMVSCQTQRVGFPDWLPMYMMAAALWNHDTDYDAKADEYFAAEFGEDGKAVRAYLTHLTELFDTRYLRCEKEAVCKENAEKFAQIPSVIDAFMPVIAAHKGEPSWDKLDIHADFCRLLSEGLRLHACGDNDGARKAFGCFRDFVGAHEDDLQPSYDNWLGIGALAGAVTR